MSESVFRLKYWYRGKVVFVEVNDVQHARALLLKVKAKGAVVLKRVEEGVNLGKWFHYITLK